MSNGFTKLFNSIITSSIWSEDDKVRIMWITMLASSDAKGFVTGSIPGMAAIARMSLKDAEKSIKALTLPDPYSRSKEYEGRRILVVDGGWQIVNYAKYRERQVHEVASLKTKGYVYYVECNKQVKIGFSKNPWARLSDLKVAAPKAKLLAVESGTLELEKQRHTEFDKDRTAGEWFNLSSAIKKHIKETSKVTVIKRSTTRSTTRSYEEAEAEAEAEADKDKRQKSDDFRLAQLLLDLICKRKPDFRDAQPDRKQKTLERWAKHVDWMIRLDHRKPERIEQVIRWCQADSGNGSWSGWQNNVLCTEKLRKQFDMLELSMGSNGDGTVEAAPFDKGAATQREKMLAAGAK